jgi:hypothetical protein
MVGINQCFAMIGRNVYEHPSPTGKHYDAGIHMKGDDADWVGSSEAGHHVQTALTYEYEDHPHLIGCLGVEVLTKLGLITSGPRQASADTLSSFVRNSSP